MLLQAGAFLLGIQAANALFHGIGQAAMVLRGGRDRPRTAEAVDREEEPQDVTSATTMTMALGQRQLQTKLCESEIEGSKLIRDDGTVMGEDSESAVAAASCRICYGGAEKDFDIRAHDGGMVGFGAEACRSTLSKLLHVGIGLALAAILNLIFEALPPPPDATTGASQTEPESPLNS